MATTFETTLKPFPLPSETGDKEYYTYVEEVGFIPRDIFKHVTSDPMGDLPRFSIHIVIQHTLFFISFLVSVTFCAQLNDFPG